MASIKNEKGKLVIQLDMDEAETLLYLIELFPQHIHLTEKEQLLYEKLRSIPRIDRDAK